MLQFHHSTTHLNRNVLTKKHHIYLRLQVTYLLFRKAIHYNIQIHVVFYIFYIFVTETASDELLLINVFVV